MMSRIELVLLSSLVLAGYSGAAANAQTKPAGGVRSDAASPSDQATQDIVVTAQRREQRLLDVPISASVVTGASLKQSNITQLQDLSTRLPNFKVVASPSTDFIDIRGVGSGNNGGFEQSVGTFVDGLYRGRSRASRASFFDIESVEVLKGPQSTFFGNNSVAGAINITTRKPTNELRVDASALYGSDNEYNVQGGIGGPLTDTIRMRVAVGASGMDGYLRNDAADEDGPHLRDLIGRVSLIWQPISALEVTTRVDHGERRDRGTYNAQLLNCPPDHTYGIARGACARTLAANNGVIDDDLDSYRTYTSPSSLHYDFTEGLVNAKLTLGGHALTFLGGYFDHKYRGIEAITPGAGASAIGPGYYGLEANDGEDFRQYSQELRFESLGNRPIGYMIGVYAAESTLNIYAVNGFSFAPLGLAAGLPATTQVASLIHNDQTQDTMSVFGSVTAKLTERLRLNVGGRYSIVDKHATRAAVLGSDASPTADVALFQPVSAQQQAILSRATGVPPSDYPKRSITDRRFMPSVSLQYTVAPDVMAYGSYATGFKAGGFGVILSSDVFGPESTNSYELGIKGVLFDHALSFNLAGFYSTYKDLQEAVNSVVGTAVITQIKNAARSESKGVEAGASLRITDKLRLSTDVAYLEATYTSFPNDACTVLQGLAGPCVQDVSGRQRAFAPKWSGNVSLAVSQPVGHGLFARAEPSVSFTSSFFQQANLDPLSVQRGYAKLDAVISLGRPNRRWEVSVIGRNLTDIATASYRTSSYPTAPGSIAALADRPRSIAVQVSTQF